MQKIQYSCNINYSLSDLLFRKNLSILITNQCDRFCGGCHQFCNHWKKSFSKQKLFEITIEELNFAINLLKIRKEILNKKKEHIIIHGGEPTIHPQWKEIKNLLKQHKDCLFVVFTKYRLTNENNIHYRPDPKNSRRTFRPTLIAPIDIVKKTSKFYYTNRAFQTCINPKICPTIIYKNKAYFCEIAASLDHYFNNGQNGWDLEENKYPFIKTENEIIKQANDFCYRCGWNLTTPEQERLPRQIISQPTIVTKTNFNVEFNLKKIKKIPENKKLLHLPLL